MHTRRPFVDEAVAAGIPVAVCSTSNERAVSTIVRVMLGPEVADRMVGAGAGAGAWAGAGACTAAGAAASSRDDALP